MSGEKRNVGYDIMRILAILMVVGIHSNVIFLQNPPGSVGWLFAMLLNTVYLVSVPLFFMISGALLLDKGKDITVKELYQKRLPKQAVPFLVWSGVYILMRVMMGKAVLSFTIFSNLLHEPAYYQFWFMYTLLGLYLILPLLQALMNTLDKQRKDYMLLLVALFSVIVPLLTRYIPFFAISSHVDLVLFEGYIGYFLLGSYLKDYGRAVSAGKALGLYAVGAVVTLVGACVEYFYSVSAGIAYVGNVYQNYLLPGVVMSSTGLFLFFQNKKLVIRDKTVKMLTAVSGLSIGVYYIHMLVLTAAKYVWFKPSQNILLLLVSTVAIYGISLMGAWIISKIPIARRWLLGMK